MLHLPCVSFHDQTLSSCICNFQQDYLTCHKSNVIWNWFHELHNDFTVLQGPPPSPHLNPVRHLWDVVEREFHRETVQLSNLQKVHDDAIIPTWTRISKECFQHCMATKKQGCFERKGMPYPALLLGSWKKCSEKEKKERKKNFRQHSPKTIDQRPSCAADMDANLYEHLSQLQNSPSAAITHYSSLPLLTHFTLPGRTHQVLYLTLRMGFVDFVCRRTTGPEVQAVCLWLMLLFSCRVIPPDL